MQLLQRASRRPPAAMWNTDAIADTVAEAIARLARDLDAEQSVHGVDHLCERRWHPVLAEALAAAGHRVRREVLYPGRPRGRTLIERVRASERERCDLVLLPPGEAALDDPVARDNEALALRGTLFEGLLTEEACAAAAAAARGNAEADRDDDVASPADCLWLEVKVVGQHCYSAGVPGPNAQYGSELVAALREDLGKLSRDRLVRRAGLLLLLMSASEETARHDLRVGLSRAVDRGVRAGWPSCAWTPFTERIGNAGCLVALTPTWGGE